MLVVEYTCHKIMMQSDCSPRGPLETCSDLQRSSSRGLLLRSILIMPTNLAHDQMIKRSSIATVGCTVCYCINNENRPDFVDAKRLVEQHVYPKDSQELPWSIYKRCAFDVFAK